MSLLLTIIGPTASGKTQLAVQAALALDGEVISADSRQVYRGMDLGTGKDLADYTVGTRSVPYHLIDIREPGYKYSIYEYQADCHRALADIEARSKTPILCGGSGLYVESVLKGYEMHEVPENPELRARLSDKSLSELTDILATYKTLHNNTDTDTCKRAIREIEIREYYRSHAEQLTALPPVPALVVGVNIDRDVRRQRIATRLRQRLDEGMVDEVRALLARGIAPEALIYYGLEYKYLTLYATGKMGYDEMVETLQIAIFQFAKRQMTWFRGMERRGITIRWVDFEQPLAERTQQVVEWYNDARERFFQ
jgi:tRNA dimethylallyltransferase